MSKFMKKVSDDASAFMHAFSSEFKNIFSDTAVLFSFILVSVVISFLYTYLYSNQVLTELPVAVVDKSQTHQSRQYLEMLDASKQIRLLNNYTDFSAAKKSFLEGESRGFIIIPEDFSKKILSGKQPFISVYVDASYFLYYKEIMSAVKTVTGYFNAGVQIKKIEAKGKLPEQAYSDIRSVGAEVVSLYNPSSGYASFLMPVVLIVIFQTTILTAVGILGGTMRERKRFHIVYPNANNFFATLPIIMGKATTYLLIGIIILSIMIGVIMPLFKIPVRSDFLTIVVYMIPYLLSVVYFGIFLLTFFKRREDALMVIMFTSIPALLISGFSWPMGSMPLLLKISGLLVPSTTGSKGFVYLTQMGSDFSTIQSDWIFMWVVCVFYLLLAAFSLLRVYELEKEQEKEIPDNQLIKK